MIGLIFGEVCNSKAYAPYFRHPVYMADPSRPSSPLSGRLYPSPFVGIICSPLHVSMSGLIPLHSPCPLLVSSAGASQHLLNKSAAFNVCICSTKESEEDNFLEMASISRNAASHSRIFSEFHCFHLLPYDENLAFIFQTP